LHWIYQRVRAAVPLLSKLALIAANASDQAVLSKSETRQASLRTPYQFHKHRRTGLLLG
jgi:hypothetical protein